MAQNPQRDPPFEGGSQRVVEVPAEVPKGGRTAGQLVAGVLVLLAVLAGLLWILVPLLS